mgnify:CR=1 FL=1
MNDVFKKYCVQYMNSYFARHEVEKQSEVFSHGEEGYPSAGRIAWALWGGDAGQSWARRLSEQEDDRMDKRAAPDALSVGDYVAWNASGGRAYGQIRRIESISKWILKVMWLANLK